MTLTSNSDKDSFYGDQSGAYQSQIIGKIKNLNKNFNSRSFGNNFGSTTSFDSTNIASVGEEKPHPDAHDSSGKWPYQL